MADYLDLEELKRITGIRDWRDDETLQAAISAASRQVESITGRSFFQDDTASVRKFRPASYYTTWVDDISTTTDLAVAVDTSDSGTATQSLTADTDYYLEPANGIVDGLAGWPYTQLCSITGNSWPVTNRTNIVHVTARWGWPAVPEPVLQACGVLATRLFKTKDAPFDVAGFGDFGVLRITAPTTALALLDPYVKRKVMVG